MKERPERTVSAESKPDNPTLTSNQLAMGIQGDGTDDAFMTARYGKLPTVG
jgi:hypothetical protein